MTRRAFIAILILLALSNHPAAASSQEIKAPGLKNKVEITYDNFGVPHITAANSYDLYFAQGYVQARDRMWQMDLMRRRATARMAELLGESKLSDDENMLLTGIPQVSQKIWDASEPDMREAFQAFSDGVNAWIQSSPDLPDEYKEIHDTPAPWSPVDSIAFGRLMSWSLSADIGMDIAIGQIVKLLGKKQFMDIAPFHGADPVTIIEWKKAAAAFPEELFPADFDLSQALYTSARTSPDFPGSNNWVVSGSRTDTGAPILSNDPHLGLDNPPIWYEIHLNAPGVNVIGSSFPCVPGVVIGHNENIAWGVTTTGYDVTDVFIEKLDPEKPSTNYMHKGKSLPVEYDKYTIRYKTPDGIKTKEHAIARTIHGPVVRENKPQSIISYRWTGHEPTFEMRAFFEINRASGLDDFKNALKYFKVGAQNFIYADVKGNIFYKAPANVPLRDGIAFMPLDGSSGKQEWTGYIPYDQLPGAENPAAGFVATANNRPAGDDYPYYIGAFFDKGYRARRITDRILAANPMTFSEMQSIQADVHSLPGERISPILIAAADKHPELLSEKASAALAIVKKWDFNASADSVACSIFHKWLKHIVSGTFNDDFPPEISGELARTELVFPLLLRDKPLPFDWYDDKKTEAIETKDVILARSLDSAVAELEKQFGEDMSEWKWGRLHKLTLNHALGGRFNIGPFEVDGAQDTVDNAGFGLMGGNFNFGGGPSMRMTVELKPGAIRAENVIPGGQQAKIDAPHYSDQMTLWLQNKAHPMLFSSDEIEKSAESKVTLTP